nr:MAG TPA: hypothetical protein [Caudoviricetes sp.]
MHLPFLNTSSIKRIYVLILYSLFKLEIIGKSEQMF